MDVKGPETQATTEHYTARHQSEALTRVFKAHGVQQQSTAPPGTSQRHSHVCSMHMEWTLTIGTLINTIRSILVYPKEKTPDAQKCGLVYQVECPECPLTYIGETGRTLATMMKDHYQPQEPTNSCGRTLCARTPQNNQGQCQSAS